MTPTHLCSLPFRASLVSNMIQAEIVQDHGIPITVQQLLRNVPRHVVIHFRKVLQSHTSRVNNLLLLYTQGNWCALTETKKLVVPSARSKKPGKSFSHVSSPYMTSLPFSLPKSLALICASHVSCVPSVEVVSDSAKFRITSTKDGMEPVVMALTRGMVMVGEVA